MAEFTRRLCTALGVVLVLAIPVGSIALINILWGVREVRTFIVVEAIVFWGISGVWLIVIGFILVAAVSGMVSDMWKALKWLFIDPFKSKNTESRFK